MDILEIIFIGLGLSMDVFAISVCKGFSIKKIKYSNMAIIAFYFSIFHILMLILGYFLGSVFSEFVDKIDHWIAFTLLAIIGINMIKNSLKENAEENDKIDFKTMIILAIVTSIDALTIGVTFAFFKVNILISALTIGIITFIMSNIGSLVGHKFGNKFENKAEIIGGIILIIIGLKILAEHLGVF